MRDSGLAGVSLTSMNFAKSLKPRFPQFVNLLAGASLLIAANTHGQAPRVPAPPVLGPVQPSPMPMMPVAPARPEPVRFGESIEQERVVANFDNLPLTEVVLWLEKTFPGVNFVTPQSLAELNPVVILRLRAAGLHDILEAINIATDGLVVSEVRSPTLVALRARVEPAPGAHALPEVERAAPPQAEPNAPRPGQRFGAGGGFGERYGGTYPGGYGTGVGMVGMPSEPAAAAYQVMNLRDIWRVNDPKKIRETLEVAEKITESTLNTLASNPRERQQRLGIKSFDYHEGSGVLVIIGQPDAIKVAMEVIRNFRLREAGGGDKSTGTAKPDEGK